MVCIKVADCELVKKLHSVERTKRSQDFPFDQIISTYLTNNNYVTHVCLLSVSQAPFRDLSLSLHHDNHAGSVAEEAPH